MLICWGSWSFPSQKHWEGKIERRFLSIAHRYLTDEYLTKLWQSQPSWCQKGFMELESKCVSQEVQRNSTHYTVPFTTLDPAFLLSIVLPCILDSSEWCIVKHGETDLLRDSKAVGSRQRCRSLVRIFPGCQGAIVRPGKFASTPSTVIDVPPIAMAVKWYMTWLVWKEFCRICGSKDLVIRCDKCPLQIFDTCEISPWSCADGWGWPIASLAGGQRS